MQLFSVRWYWNWWEVKMNEQIISIQAQCLLPVHIKILNMYKLCNICSKIMVDYETKCKKENKSDCNTIWTSTKFLLYVFLNYDCIQGAILIISLLFNFIEKLNAYEESILDIKLTFYFATFFSSNKTAACRPIAGQRPQNGQRVQPLLCNRQKTNASFYPTVPLLLDYNNGNSVFYVVHGKML
jgi:hypothetical protein